MADKRFGDFRWRLQDVGGRDAHNFDPPLVKPGIACRITLRPVAHLVCDPVDLDADFGGRAVEIEHVVADRVLATESDIALST
ncbi:hypothetical protein A3719_11960 [Erythrobacter sp. HI0020]|nr:hypothetical protein A3719_11960 [Erythrobacter sp. HI0020]